MNLEFANQYFLLLLLLLVPLALVHFKWIWHRRRTLKYSDLQTLRRVNKTWARYLPHVPFWMRLVVLALLIVALARPRGGATVQDISSEGIDIVLTVDVSTSMLAEDLKKGTNRLEVAKQVVTDFINRRRHDRIGCVAFAAKAVTCCPLTLDYRILNNQVAGLSIGMLEDGTAIGVALASSVNRLRNSSAKSRVIVLLTDGMNNRGEIDPITAARIAEAENVKVYTIGVGTRGMAPIPVRDEFGRVRYVNQQVKIDEETLKEIASITGGKYYRATKAKELEEIARRYPNSPKAAISLYYAAEGYEQTRRFRKAKAIYEEIVKNPKYREQIRRVKEEDCTGSGSHQRCRTKVSNKLDNVVNFLAQAAWKAMEFDAAMKYYGQLAKGKVPTDEPAIRVNAYYWYARLLRIYDKPRDSVTYFMKYYRDITKVIAALQKKLNKTTNPQDRKDLQAQLSEARRFRVEVFYEIGKIYEHLNDLGGMERYYGTYIRQVADRLGSRNTASSDYYKKNAGDRAAAMKMMEALHKLAQGNKARHRTRKASEYEQKIVSYFDKFHMPKGENPAADYAAEIAFRQVESEFRRFMARKLTLRSIRLKARIRKGMKAKGMLAAMCELMGWGKNRRTGQLCAPGKALLMLRDVVNPYVAEVNKLTQKLYNDVGLKYLHPKWVLAVRARMGQMFVKAATDLDGLPVPSEVKSFWKVFWTFVQKYKASYRAFFEKLMSVYELDIDDEELDQDTILDAYKDKTYTTIRKNSQALRNEAIRNFVEGIKLARSLGMATKWTKIMRKGLSDIDPDRFPYVHDAKVAK